MILSKTNYSFKVLTEADFECIIDFQVSKYIFNFIYNGALKKLGIAGDKTKVTNIKVPIDKQYYNLLNTSMSKIMRYIANEVKPDGFKILRHVVKDAYFIKTNVLNIFVALEGNYIKT